MQFKRTSMKDEKTFIGIYEGAGGMTCSVKATLENGYPVSGIIDTPRRTQTFDPEVHNHLRDAIISAMK